MARNLDRVTARRIAGAVLWLGLVAVVGAGGALWYVASRSPQAASPAPAYGPVAGSVKIAWDPSPGARVVGYKVLYGTAPGQYTGSMDVANLTTAVLTGLRVGSPYFIVVVALDAQGNRSPPSNEVTVTPE